MWTSLRVAASAMHAHQRALDVAANNINNAQSTGYKSRRANVVDQPPEALVFGIPGENGGVTLDRREVSPGVTVGAILPDQTPGPFVPTGQPLDVAIDGTGYLQVALPDGRAAYTRDGALHIDAFGRLATTSGAPLAPGITVPVDARDLKIERDGTVSARIGDGEPLVIGQLELVRVANPDGLENVGKNLLLPTEASGLAQIGAPGTAGLGSFVTESLEASNVDTSTEYLRIMHAQRAYQLNVRAMKTIDEMLAGANNLRR